MANLAFKETELSNQQNEQTIGNIEDFGLTEVESKTFNEIFESFKISDEELNKLIKNHANDNFPMLPTDPDGLAQSLDEVEIIVKKEMVILRSTSLTEEEYQRRLGNAQQYAA